VKLAKAETQLAEQAQVLKRIKDIDLDELSPRKAFDIIISIRENHIVE
jgi:hypothetical protein